MEDKILELCKKVIDGETPSYICQEVMCVDCPFGDAEIECETNSIEIKEIAQKYIEEHEKTVNTIEKIEEKITLKELQEIKNNVELKGTVEAKILPVGNLKDIVNHPKHYTNGKYECINVIEDVTKDLVGLEAVCTANVIKYMWRWKLKNGVEDLKKARWYLNKLIDNTEIKETEDTYQAEGMAD